MVYSAFKHRMRVSNPCPAYDPKSKHLHPLWLQEHSLARASAQDVAQQRSSLIMSEEGGDASLCRVGHDNPQPLHVRYLRLYEDFHREAHVTSPPAQLLEIIARCKSVVGSSSHPSTSRTLVALRKKATAHLILNQPKRALSTAEQIVRTRVDWAYGHLLKADAYLGLRHFATAAKLYQLTRELMPSVDPTDDFGRTEIDEQRAYLFGCIASRSCITMTQAHDSEVTAVASWPPINSATRAHLRTCGAATSARALQASVNGAVNEALEAMSLGGAHVQLPKKSSSAYSMTQSSCFPEFISSPRSEPTLDNILAERMQKNLLMSSKPASCSAGCTLDAESSEAYSEGVTLRSSWQSKLQCPACVQRCIPAVASLNDPVTSMTLGTGEQTPEVMSSASDSAILHSADMHSVCHGCHCVLSCQPDESIVEDPRRPNLVTDTSEATCRESPRGAVEIDTHIFLATGDLQGCLRIWDVSRLECSAVLHGHSSGITCLTFATSLRKGVALLLASADAEGAVVVSAIDLSGNLIESGMLEKLHQNRVVSMRFVSGGCKLVTSSVDTTVRIWNVATGRLTACLDAHQKPVTGMDCTSIMSAVAVATCSVQGVWYLWDLKRQEHYRTGSKAGAANMIKFSPRVHGFNRPRPLLVTAHWVVKKASLHLWDVFDPNMTGLSEDCTDPWHSFHGIAHGQVQDIAFTTDDHNKTLMAVAALDGSLIIYDVFARSVLTHMTDGHKFSSGTYMILSILHLLEALGTCVCHSTLRLTTHCALLLS